MRPAIIRKGDLFAHNGQHYFCVSVTLEKSTRRNRPPYELAALESLCANCGKVFTQYVGQKTTFYDKRCRKHRAPGKPVKADRTVFG
ncbi:hypothetical protein J2X50_003511 [Aminobacter sp. BE322]